MNMLFTYSKEDFANNEAKTRFYTGLPNFLVLLQIINLCEPWISHTERSALNKFERNINSDATETEPFIARPGVQDVLQHQEFSIKLYQYCIDQSIKGLL